MVVLLTLAGCAEMPPPPPAPPAPPPIPTAIAGGKGSQNGNYPTFETGGVYNSPTDPCPILAWDRPVSGGYVIRYLSAACPAPAPGRPDAVIMRDLGRTLLPFDQSPLATPPGG